MSADLRDVSATEIAVEAFDDVGHRIMTAGGTSAGDHVALALVTDDTGRAFTTSTAHVAEAVGLSFGLGDDSAAFAVSPSSGEVLRFVAEFGE